jgi:hypothetical protein
LIFNVFVCLLIFFSHPSLGALTLTLSYLNVNVKLDRIRIVLKKFNKILLVFEKL